MRPSGETAVASARTRPAPPTARAPKFTKCQSLGTPCTAEYWHIGETAIRFLRCTSLSVSSLKSVGIGGNLHGACRAHVNDQTPSSYTLHSRLHTTSPRPHGRHLGEKRS